MARPHFERLSPEREQHLARCWQGEHDASALHQLVSSHIGLVVQIAQDYRHAGPALDDLIQEGHVGLLIAARKFDPERGLRLTTYASYWIRACMIDFVVRSHGPVRIGTSRGTRRVFFNLGRARARLDDEGKTHTPEAIAADLGVSETDVVSMLPRLAGSDVSLDAPYRDGSPRSRDTLGDASATCEADIADREEHEKRRLKLREEIERLEPRERRILLARFYRPSPTPLRELGVRLGISRERVRQVELIALRKLRRAIGEPAFGKVSLRGLLRHEINRRRQ